MEDRAAELARTQAFILAGGQGERLHPLTVSRPKPAVSFGGMFRIIDFTLSNCLHSGLSRVSVLTQYKSDELHRYLRDGWWELWNSTPSGRLPIECLPPASGKRYRGTADAVFQNLALLNADTDFVVILSGDHIYQMDYRSLLRQHIQTGAAMTIATVEHSIDEASQFGVVEVDSNLRVTGFEEKPMRPRPMPSDPTHALVSMGIYIFSKSVLQSSLRSLCETGIGHDFGRDVIPALIRSGRVYAYDFRNIREGGSAYWRDIGTVDAYHAASMDLLGEDPPFDPFFNTGQPAYPTRHPVGADAASIRVSAGACVTRCVLSPGVQIEAGANLDEVVLLPGVRVGKGARLRRAIVEEDVTVPAGFQVGLHPARDREYYTVTKSGVVVIDHAAINKAAANPLLFATRRSRSASTRRPDGVHATA